MKACRSKWAAARRLLRTAGGVAIALAASNDQVGAQIVRGHVVDVANDRGIGGVMVRLLTPNGVERDRILTREPEGFFELQARIPGRYRLRADRIGYAATFSDFLVVTVGDTVNVRMQASVEPVSLAAITVQTDRRCQIRPEDGLAVAQVWEEARKALASAAWTRERGMYQYEMLEIRREMDRDARKVLSEYRDYAQGPSEAPYVARSADSLVADGFARFTAEESVFWAPDAAVLLSDPFLDTHCLRLRRVGEGSRLIGLDFEPVRNRSVPEISGTVWLDTATAHVERMDFRFENLAIPPALLKAEPGGTVRFRLLPNGSWIVASWHLRMFRPGMATHPLTGRPAVTLDGVTMKHGMVLRATGDEGVVYEGGTRRRIVGSVLDSLGVGLSGAKVYIDGSGAEATTDATGRFELSHLEPGIYPLRFSHSYLDELLYQTEPQDVRIRREDTAPAETEFRAPPIARVFDEICDNPRYRTMPVVPVKRNDASEGTEIAWREGMLMGRVVDEAGAPVQQAEIAVVVQAYDLGDTDTSLVDTDSPTHWVDVRGETSSSGFYRACWVPVGIPVQVVVLNGGQRMDLKNLEDADALAKRFPARATTITIQREDPYRRADFTIVNRTDAQGAIPPPI